MTQKNDASKHYIQTVTTHIKEACSLRELFVRINGFEPSREELQQLRNRLTASRSNPGTDMLGLLVQHIPELHDMKLKEFFGLDEPKLKQLLDAPDSLPND